ncbi:hypothetical protein ASPZODRAFT_124718 [Penicilliopsis zonata CBS 506.65]|uniref:Phenylacetaldoxime dehydratase n=1 Tax=Penicilliopsis zonata CBS 506.65 TaxID=1073090 RepID=A0A1L9S6L3_9EURO|nr:hypothetical protein ASPZODRAFT_124718 [Penicilliopsis zonata CBS 506.65]OJJ42763.1 hypothetical protein ASPZODRAFT_124718 [Penicilliopsis zonata CBS 506.65]
MLTAKFSQPFVQCLFGCQYHGASPTEQRATIINFFQALLQSSAAHVEILESEDGTRPGFMSKLFLAYWRQETDYQSWWSSEPVTQFWHSLPDDAGFWREKLTLRPSRVLYETNKHIPTGFANVAQIKPLVEKTGYWGSYRDRIEDSTPEDKLESKIQLAAPPSSDDEIRLGRTTIKHFPDNICFVVEGQDRGSMEHDEKHYWTENFQDISEEWILTAIHGGHEDGIISARLCQGTDSGLFKPETDKTNALSYNRTVQVFYFTDMSWMERIGRKYKSHVTLRRRFMEAYGPGGVMENGNILLWVDLGILKGQDMEAEYIGCYDDTGFLAYRERPGFTVEACL